MKRNWMIFFIIALAAEVGTTWGQSLFNVVSHAPGGAIYYPDFAGFLTTRLVIWGMLFFAISGIWGLIVRLRKGLREQTSEER